MFELKKNKNGYCFPIIVGGEERRYPAYALHADHLSDLGDEFESALRDVVNGIADKLADENGVFEFETCSQVLANIVNHCEEIVTITSYEDMDRLGAEFDALPFESPFEERNRYGRFLEFHVNGRCDDGTPSVEFNQWSLCEPFADRSIYDEFISRGMDAEDARWRANGFLRDMIGDTYLPRDWCQFDDYTPCEAFSCIVCAVNKLFPKERAPRKEYEDG